MNYQPAYKRSRPNRFSEIASTIFIVLILVGVFVYAVWEFRKPKPENPEPVASIENVLKPSPLLVSLEESAKEITGVEKAKLEPAGDRPGSGSATRQIEDGIFFHTIKAALPAIDRTRFFYEGWLVRKVPFDYFSTGEMITNNLSEFVLSFEGDPRGNYGDYTQVVVTLEEYDGNPDPSEHVLRGEFTGEALEAAEARGYWETFYPPGLGEEEP